MVKDDKTRKTGADPVSTGGKMGGEAGPKKIMVQPLPQILDEIEESLISAKAAALDARNAAEEARRAGEKAANEAARVAAEMIARVEKVAKEGLELAKLLNATITEAATTVEKKLTKKA